MAALEAAYEVIDTLAHSEQLQARLTEASLHRERGWHQTAIRRADTILVEAGHTEEPGMDFVRVRALHIRGEARLEQGRDPIDASDRERAIEDLEAAAEGFDRLGMWDRRSAALASLAEVYVLIEQDNVAETHLEEAFALARLDASAKPEIFARLVRGRIRAGQGRFDEARRDFERGLALADSTGLHKHTFDLVFERARLDESRRALSQAHRRFEGLSRRDVPFADGAVRAVALKEKAGRRAAELEREILRRERGLLRFGLAVLALLVLAALAVAVETRKRLAQETWRRELESKLREGAMLRYMYEAVHHPRQVASQIRERDQGLARRLERGRLRGRTELYKCVVHLVFAIEQREISHDAVRINLRRLFARRGWDDLWPKGSDPVEAWKRHFEKHPLD